MAWALGMGSIVAAEVPAWPAELTCRLARRGPRTILAARDHRGPLLVQRPFYPEPADQVCHLVLVHPPGGVAAGDGLRQHMALEQGAQAVITTPAATKFYRSSGPVAQQHTRLRLAAGAQLEWLPQATILFNSARVQMTTVVELADGADFIGWEILVFGRTANDSRFETGFLHQRFELWRGDRPLWIERAHFVGGDSLLVEPWGLHGMPVSATMVCTSAEPERLVQAARSLPACPAPGRSAATALADVAVCRYIGPWAAAAQEHLLAVWAAWRPRVFGRAACVPRIWAT